MGETIIKHQAKVTKILPGGLEVAIRTEEACAACQAKSACGMGAGRDKRLVVDTPEAACYKVGETVVVMVEQAMGIKAVLLAYVFPFLSVMAVLLGMLQGGCGELASGLAAMGLLVVYYCGLYLGRNRIAKEIIFKVGKSE